MEEVCGDNCVLYWFRLASCLKKLDCRNKLFFEQHNETDRDTIKKLKGFQDFYRSLKPLKYCHTSTQSTSVTELKFGYCLCVCEIERGLPI